jgi:hypothetical protein
MILGSRPRPVRKAEDLTATSLTLSHHLLNVLLQFANKYGLLKKKKSEPIVDTVWDN